jgi:hypothetical protein
MQSSLDGQAGPALGTPRLDDQTAILGAHAGAESVGTLAVQIAGLESSFHDRNSLTAMADSTGQVGGAKNAQW